MKSTRPQLTYENVRTFFHYDPETGRLIWLPRPRSSFASRLAYVAWTARYAGKEAGSLIAAGYRFINIKKFMGTSAHRVAWLWTHGEWPDTIDHIDGDPSNNRLSNLRNVSMAENRRNVARTKLNKTGVSGVCFDKSRQKWMAYGSSRPNVNLGRHDTLESAIAARKEWEKTSGYHPNHGRPLKAHHLA